MLIEKAYCVELDKIVTAYEAREAFFSDKNDCDKFHFYCANACCGIEIYGVNLYTHAKIRQCPHFRKKPKIEHEMGCDWHSHDTLVRVNNEKNKSYTYGIKESPFPSELIFRGPEKTYKTTPVSLGNDNDLNERIKLAHTRDENNSKQSPNKTIFLEHIVDCYEAASNNPLDKRLDTCMLTINGKTKNYKSFFKKIRDCREEEGLIYYGELNVIKSKEYGKGSYRIVFKDKVNYNGENISASIYINKIMIEQYLRKKLFLKNIKELMALTEHDQAQCYFVGAHPELKNLTDKKNPSKTFCVYDIALKSLDHLVIKFSDAGAR